MGTLNWADFALSPRTLTIAWSNAFLCSSCVATLMGWGISRPAVDAKGATICLRENAWIVPMKR